MAWEKRGILKLKYPVEHGMVTNWNDWEKIMHHTLYNELRVTPEEHPILLTEPPLNPKNNREKMTSIMFETFNVAGLYIAISEVLALVSAGKTSGIVLGSGAGVTHAVPIYETHAIEHAVMRMNLAGRDATSYLVKILCERGYEMTTSAEREIVRDLKEKLSYVAADFEAEIDGAETSDDVEREYVLPDGSKMTIGSERFRTPEIMFKPSLVGSELCGVHETLFQSIEKASASASPLRNLFCSNIVLAGGNTLFKGFPERLSTELKSLLLEEKKGSPEDADSAVVASLLDIHAGPERRFADWAGASVLTSMDSFRSRWITVEEYDDVGATIVHRKCW